MPEYELKSELIKARIKSGLTQSQLAQRMGIKQPNLARLESASGDFKFQTIVKYARALWLKQLNITPN